MYIEIFLIIVGFYLLIKGADILVEGAESIAKRFHIPEIVIGLTVVSVGTSLPELFVSIKSALEGVSDIAMGNVIGSNIANLLLVLGLAGLVRPMKFHKTVRKIDIPILLAVTVLFVVLANINADISKIDSIIFLIALVCFIGYTIVLAKKTDEQEEENENEAMALLKKDKIINDIKSCAYIIGGILGLKFGGDFIVNNSINIASSFGISEKIIGLTIISIGTSLPEVVTVIVAARKGDSDIAIGNVIGSNIFNILMILGLTGVILPINYLKTYNIQTGILLLATVMLLIYPYVGRKNEMTRIKSAIYVMLYIVYMATVFILP